MRCKSADDALAALAPFDAHRFGALLHRYELSNWVLYARAYADASDTGAAATEVDRALRAPDVVALDWLAARWVSPAKPHPPGPPPRKQGGGNVNR
jgi:hypothetical protein